MKCIHPYVFCVAILSILFSCAPRPAVRIVLLGDDQGKAGAISVSNPHGTRVVDRGGYAVNLYGTEQPPGEPFSADPAKLKTDFGQVLEAVPPAPIVYTLYFEFGRRKLSPASVEKIPEIVAAIQNRSIPLISIIGHTDRSGDKERNDRLALNRAQAVHAILTTRGISIEQITEVISHGENNPAIPTENGVKEERNRRVEIIIR